MGLPLFTSPTEKDSHTKASGNDGVLASSRSSIRRQPVPRDRNHSQTRQAALRALAISPPYLPPALERYHGGSFPWNNSEPSVDPERRSPTLQPPEPMRVATGSNITRDAQPDPRPVDERFRNPLWEFLRNASQSPPVRSVSGEGRPEDRNWWPTDLRSRPRRARVVTPAGSRQTSSHRRLRPRAINSPPPPLPGPNRVTIGRAPRGVDGLGDRDRSLSPDGWDALGSTLEPDPQAPNAGSSFALAAAPHAEGPFSFYDAETSQGVDGPEGGCESGGDESGAEAPEFEDYHRHMRRRRAELRHRSLRGPQFRFDSSPGDDGVPGTQPPSRENSSMNALRIARLRNIAARDEVINAARSGDETETDRSRQTGGEPGSRRVSPAGEEDEWIGIQRIMQSLASRDEVPDEMWAEVGLIRTLLRPEETS